MFLKILFGTVGGLALVAFFALLLGGLIAIMWNSFPFLESLQHLNWWHGTVMYLLTGTLFRATVSVNN